MKLLVLAVAIVLVGMVGLIVLILLNPSKDWTGGKNAMSR